MFFSRFALGCLVGLLGCLLGMLGSASAFGQRTEYSQFEETGVIAQLGPTAVQLRRVDGGTRTISLTPQKEFRQIPAPQVEVTAPIRLDQIEVGMTAQFRGYLDKEGTITPPLKEMSVSAVATRPAAPKTIANVDEKNYVEVIGPIHAIEEGVVTVAIRGGLLTARATDGTKVILRGLDPRLVKLGNKILVRGFSKAKPMQDPLYYAQFVSVELSELPGADVEAQLPQEKPDAPPLSAEVGEADDNKPGSDPKAQNNVQVLKIN